MLRMGGSELSNRSLLTSCEIDAAEYALDAQNHGAHLAYVRMYRTQCIPTLTDDFSAKPRL